MRAERFGSYSIVATLPGTPNFSRLKSIRRIFCLCPPPWWRIVRSPELRRPPVRLRVTTSGLCGLSAVKSSVASDVWKRSVGVIGLYVLIAIVVFLDEPASGLWPPAFRPIVLQQNLLRLGEPRLVPVLEFLPLQVAHILRQLFAGLQLHVGLLPVRPVAGVAPAAAFLAGHVGGAHRSHLHLEERLDGLLHFGLGRPGSHVEDQRPLGLLHAQPLLGNKR